MQNKVINEIFIIILIQINSQQSNKRVTNKYFNIIDEINFQK